MVSNASGQFKLDDLVLDRGTIMNVNNTSSVEITEGTVIGTNSAGISNNGILNLGIRGDGIINSSSPTIIGKTYGIKNYSIFNFYDGTVKGIDDTIDGVITEREISSNIINGIEQIDSYTYKTIHLEATE